MAFMDIHPINPGHVLVIPKMHARYLSELEPEIGGYTFKVVMRVSRAVRNSGVKCDGVNIYVADGEAAAQEIPHVHLHVIPRYFGDGLRLRFRPAYGSLPDEKELEKIAERIRIAMS
jgi:histidine triad (HIT) family protein